MVDGVQKSLAPPVRVCVVNDPVQNCKLRTLSRSWKRLREVLERVDEYNAQRMKLTAEMVDASANGFF